MRYVIHVDVALRRSGRWLLVVRGQNDSHAPGMLSLVGGLLGSTEPGSNDVFEATARREVAEEIGVDLTDTPLRYVGSTVVHADDDTPVVNVTYAAHLPADAHPVVGSPNEVAALVWCHESDLEAGESCPRWTRQSIRRAAEALREHIRV